MLKADDRGFLIGQPLDDREAERLLSGIKGDTGRILSLLRGKGSTGGAARTSRAAPAAATVAPAGRSGAAPRLASSAQVARLPTVAPAGRAAPRATPARDPVTGRFVAASPGSTPARTMADVAKASEAIARSVEQQRRDERADRASQTRGADGRFGAGSRNGGPGGGGGGGGALLGALSGAGQAVQGAEQIDPLLAAMGEVRGLADTARAVVTPIGRAGSFMLGRGGGANDDPPGLLRRVWRELRGMRKDEAKTSRDTLRKLKDVEEAAGRTGSSGPGLLQSLLSALPGGGLLKNLLPAGAGAVAGAAAGAGSALKGMLRRLPVVGSLIEAVTGVVEDQRIANDAELSDEERRRERAENAGSTTGAIGGALAGAAIGQAVIPIPIVGGVVGAIAGGLAGSNMGKRAGGWISGMFESGRGGAGTISTGRGDHGGKSYGTHQLSSNTGTLQRYLAGSPYAAQFAGLAPGSAAFDAKWKALAASDPAFAASQHDFMQRTHVDPLANRLKSAGMDLSGRGQAVQEMLWSTATQFGPGTDVVKRALSGMDLSSASDAAIITAVQDYKAANNATLFRSSPQLQPSLLNRAVSEKSALLALATQTATPATVAGLGPARLPALPTVPVLPPVPQLDPLGSASKLNSDKPVVVQAPTAPAGQDVADRTIAHIVTGGIGGGIAHR